MVLPVIDQLIVPVGATEPDPVTTVVKFNVELSEPPPTSDKTTVGVTCAIFTVNGVVAASVV